MKLFRKILSIIRGEQNIDKLIQRGLKVGKNLHRFEHVFIDPSHCWHITIGDDVTIGAYTRILAHDTSTFTFLGYTKVANIKIGDRVFIGVNCIIMPGVTIGDDVIIGAGSIVTHDIPNNSVAVGNPARVLCSLDDYITKERGRMNNKNCFGEEYTLRNPNINEIQKEQLIDAANQYGIIYIV